MRIVVLYNVPSEHATADQRDVLVQRDAVAAALANLGHATSCLGCTLDLGTLQRTLLEIRPDLVFNLVESLGDTDRLMTLATLLLDGLRIPYTGASTQAILDTSNKLAAKTLLRQAGLPTPPWLDPDAPGRIPRQFARETLVPSRQTGAEPLSVPTVRGSDEAMSSRIRGNGGRCGTTTLESETHTDLWIVKPVWEHASFGMEDDAVIASRDISYVEGQRHVREQRFQCPFFAERFVVGREFNLSLLAGQVLPPAEIDFSAFPVGKPRIVGQQAKWEQNSFEYQQTPRRFDFPDSDEPLLDQLSQCAARCWQLFGLAGYARVDFRVDEGGQPWILEVNANPCLAPDAGFAAAVSRAGMRFGDAVQTIIEDATLRHDGQVRPPTPSDRPAARTYTTA